MAVAGTHPMFASSTTALRQRTYREDRSIRGLPRQLYELLQGCPLRALSGSISAGDDRATRRHRVLYRRRPSQQRLGAAERGSDDDEERRELTALVVTLRRHSCSSLRGANDVGRHGGRLVCPISVREVKN